jgi:hypothetical protein
MLPPLHRQATLLSDDNMKFETMQRPSLTGIIGILAAVTMGMILINFSSAVMERYSLSFGFVLALILVILWVICSGRYWWLVFPVMALWGGLFYVGFKIYPNEIGLLIAGTALIVALLKDYPAVAQRRSPVTWAFLLLVLYFIIHMLISLSMSSFGWLSGGGSIIRVYAGGISYLLFAWLYYKFGTSKHIKLAVVIIFILMLVRTSISMLYIYIPLLFDTSKTDIIWLYSSSDLRISALYQMFFGIMLFYLVKSRLIKTCIIIFIIAMAVLVLFGQGRVSVIMAFSIMILWMLLAKRLRLLIYLLPVFIVCILFIYSDSHILTSLPREVQRAISFLPGLENRLIYYTTRSNEWHFELMRLGYQRWTYSFISFLFGNYVDPTGVYQFSSLSYYLRTEVAATTGRYECTLWTIIATLGLIAMVLYIWIFRFLFREIIPIVRKEGIISFNHAVYAVAIISLLLMILFGWIRGSFPDIELMLGVMAKALYEDNKNKI